jgi:hypothetical protein
MGCLYVTDHLLRLHACLVSKRIAAGAWAAAMPLEGPRGARSPLGVAGKGIGGTPRGAAAEAAAGCGMQWLGVRRQHARREGIGRSAGC